MNSLEAIKQEQENILSEFGNEAPPVLHLLSQTSTMHYLPVQELM